MPPAHTLAVEDKGVSHVDWIAVAWAALFGAIGGLVLDLIKDRTLDLPHPAPGGLYLGFISDLVAGAVGGIVAYAAAGGGHGLTPALLANILSGSGLAGILKAAGYDPLDQKIRASRKG